MKLWQCSICQEVGKWSESWQAFSSLAIDDEWPQWRVIVCSKKCEDVCDKMRKLGTIKMPELRYTHGQSHIRKPAVGYLPQPDQHVLLELWNKQMKPAAIHGHPDQLKGEIL